MIEKDQTLTAGGLDTDTTVSGVISGDGGFKKVGDGTTSFSGDNTYSGSTEIKAGTLKVTGSLSDATAVSSLRVPPMKLPTVMRLVRLLG